MRNHLIGFLAVCLILGCSLGAIAETQMSSVKQKETPYLMGIGFALKSLEEYIPSALHVTIIRLTDLQTGQGTKPSFKAKLEFGADKYPVKIISPEPEKFEADIMEPNAKEKELATPIGHITLGVSTSEGKPIATGTLRIKTANEKSSGEFTLLLNALAVPNSEKGDAQGEGREGGSDAPAASGDTAR